MANVVNTVWRGPFRLGNGIGPNAIYGFRNGGCCALAVALGAMVPDFRFVLMLDGEPDAEDYENLTTMEIADDYFTHAGILLPGNPTPLDVGGFEEWKRGDVIVCDESTMLDVLETCPTQHYDATVRMARMVLNKHGIQQREHDDQWLLAELAVRTY